MRAKGRWLRWTFALLAWLACAFAPAGAADDADARLSQARSALQAIEQRVQDAQASDHALAGARRELFGLQREAEAIADASAPQAQAAQARLSALGAAPPAGTTEPPDVAQRRSELQAEAARLDARAKLARLLAQDAEQLADRVGSRQRARFQAQLLARTDSPLSVEFWDDLRSSLPRDAAQLDRLRTQLFARTSAASGWLGAGALLLVAVALVLRVWLGRRLVRVVSADAPRARRSAYALARALLAMLVPGAAAWALLLAAQPDSPELRALLEDVVGRVGFSAYVTGLGSALLLASQPSRRLLPIPDRVAQGLRSYPLMLGVAIFAAWLLRRLATLADAGLPTTVAIEALVTLVLGLVLLRFASRRERLRRRALAAAHAQVLPRQPAWLGALVALARLLLAASLVAILAGYVALGGFVVRQAVWAAIVVPSWYLLDATLASAAGAWLAHWHEEAREDGVRHREQLAVLVAGVLRLSVLLVAVTLLLVPFGENPAQLLVQRLGNGITIGELPLRPAAIVRALAVLAIALAALRTLERWLDRRFLPTTALDAGMRSSLLALLGFVGVVLAVALSLSALGLALEKVTWIASALTVGIGFGMQAVVSNFVSGLILLAERPVKVGDRVALGAVEGDIERIKVRATELRMADRSTLVVPNSEFITKVVRNVTPDDAPGVVQLRLPMPLDSDVDRVRRVLLDAFVHDEAVLREPPPSVLLDGIEGDKLVFRASGFVASPRSVDAVRSAVLERVLRGLRTAPPSA